MKGCGGGSFGQNAKFFNFNCTGARQDSRYSVWTNQRADNQPMHTRNTILLPL